MAKRKKYTLSGFTAAEIGRVVAEKLDCVSPMDVSVRVVWMLDGNQRHFKVWITEGASGVTDALAAATQA
jgi:hypothetical protein